MKWLYIVVGLIVCMVVGKYVSDNSIRNSDVQVIHSGAQPW
jgi:hypothetical protein